MRSSPAIARSSVVLPAPEGPNSTVIDAFSNNLRVQVVEDACFDRSEVSHAVNLGDMNAKYADVVPSADVFGVFAKLDGAAQAADRPRIGP